MHISFSFFLIGQLTECPGVLKILTLSFYDFSIFSGTVYEINVELCMMVLLIKFYLFIPLSVIVVTAMTNSFN